ncbi:MAG: hypothetical protein COS84_09400 [Armatimonadetes bacterium CG07_land_8_20_14_0_80_40_9]|nr:MAG: hypothetical protein COS84_09400 [Armatimonadetes bacterium CG07_land_8_20_14_0_80_40_9]
MFKKGVCPGRACEVVLYFLLVFFHCFCICRAETPSLEEKIIALEADYLAYCADKNVILATGGILLTFRGIKINADSLQVSLNQRILKAQGNISLSREEEEGESSQLILQGDSLSYNLETLQGSIIRVSKRIERIYFIGEDLMIISSPIEEEKETIPVPDLAKSNLSIVAKKIRVSLGDKFEAWHVSFWVKGYHALSLPYYTTAAEGVISQIPLQLKGINYGSENGWDVDSRVNYSQKGKAFGALNLNYQSRYQKKSKEKWTADLEQHYSLGEKKEGVLYFNRLGEKLWNTRLSYNHYFSKTLSGALSVNYYNNNIFSSQLDLRKRKEKGNFSLNLTQSKTLHKKGESFGATTSWQAYPEQIKGTRISLSKSLGFQYSRSTHPQVEDLKVNFRFSLYKSAIYLTRFAFLNLNTTFEDSLSLKGKQSNTLSTSASVTSKFGRSSYLNLIYSTSRLEGTNQVKSISKNISANLTLGRASYWNTHLRSNYNLKTHRIEEGRPYLEVKLNKLLRLKVNMCYSFKEKRWSDFTPDLIYNIFGEGDRRHIEGIWWQKGKRYWVGLSSMM